MPIHTPPSPYLVVLGDEKINLLLRDDLDTLLMEDKEIDFNPSMDIEELKRLLVNDYVPVPRVFDEPLGNSNSMSRSIKTSDLILKEPTTEIGLDDSIQTEINDGITIQRVTFFILNNCLMNIHLLISPAVLPIESSLLVPPLPNIKKTCLREVERFDPFFTLTQSDTSEKSDDADDSDMDLTNDEPKGDDDTARYGVFMYNKSTKMPKFTYFSLTITSYSLDFIQNLLDETPVNELTDLMRNPVYTDAQTTSVVHNLEGNPEVKSFLSGASEVPFGTHVDVQATNLVLQEMFPDDAKKNMRKINFKKEVAQKFREYDQKLEALTYINVSEAFEKVEALDAQDAELSFHKRSHDNQDTLNNHEGEKRKDLGSVGAAKRRTTWFDLLLKSDIDQNDNHIRGPSTVTIANKLKALIQKDELTIPDLEGARLEKLKQQYKNNVELEYRMDQLKAAMLSEPKWNSDEDDVSKPRLFKRNMSKNTKPHPSFYNNDFYYLVSLSTKEKYTTSLTKHYAARYYIQGIEDMISDRWCKETHCYYFEALNVKRSDDNEYEFSYADLPRLILNNVEDMYLLQVQDKLHHLLLEFVEYFNNALLLFIRRVVIQNRVEDIQLGVESYQQTLNLTKPMIEVKKSCDGTLMKIRGNLIDTVNTYKLAKGNRRLKGKD
ncbi:hypothetical protein Tco_1438402 [Tanacetum coccineum]